MTVITPNARPIIRHRLEEMLRQFHREMIDEAKIYGHHFTAWEKAQVLRLALDASRFADSVSERK